MPADAFSACSHWPRQRLLAATWLLMLAITAALSLLLAHGYPPATNAAATPDTTDVILVRPATTGVTL